MNWHIARASASTDKNNYRIEQNLYGNYCLVIQQWDDNKGFVNQQYHMFNTFEQAQAFANKYELVPA
jgi:hypothetical protein